MPFPPKLLNDGEEVVLDLRPHWWYMAEPFAALVGSIVLGVILIANKGDGTVWDIVSYAVVALIVVNLAWFLVRMLRWTTTNFVVTSDRVISRSGVIAKRGIEIPLERINTVFFNQTIFERLIGAGDLSIESGGETGKQTFSDIRKPSLVQNEIYRQMESNSARMHRGEDRMSPRPQPQGSVTQQLSELDDLRKRGIITESEFAEKKAELLRRL